jgi:alkylation response protein AidB-like acyl-CoA dehydrogenase
MCLALTDWDVPKHRGLTWFAVPTDAPGVTIRPLREITGTVEFCEEFLDDVELTDDAVIGVVNDGWSVAQTMLVHERLASDASFRSPDEIIEAVDPKPMALARRAGRDQDPVVRQLVARIHTLDFVQCHLNERVAARLRLGTTSAAATAAYSKLAAGIFDPQRARMTVEIGGATAILWDADDPAGPDAALDYLNGRVMSIAGGTNEMQRNGIGERVLGLPREPSFDKDKPFSEVIRAATNTVRDPERANHGT